jgi:glutathione S-transferase
MADKLVFYTNPMSRGRIIRWMLEEVGEPYETVVLDYASTMKGPDYLAINPMGKVPAITHGGTVVTECAAICAYLADAFPQKGLAPAPTEKLRGPYYRWLFFAAGPLEAAASNKAMGWELPQDKEAMAGYGSLARVANVLEDAVSKGPYILGERFSAADVYVGSHIGWGMQFGTLEKRPAFETYFGRLAQRPAAQRAREIDDGLIAAAKKAG